ncbi:MAG: acyl-CoA dehydrogenase family protein [Bdellovibrio sp.]|nr:acyl-CoA dehydrogenase family protein [Bdellovibrio sp.]
MINFQLNDDQLAVKETALKFAINEMRPAAAHHDQTAEFPKNIIHKAWELGLINTCIPAEYGGVGFGHVDGTVITECLAYGCLGMNTSIMSNDLALLPIVIAGNHEQKEKFLRPFTEKFQIASFCLTEPANGSDAAGIKTSIKDMGDHFLLNGNKMWITNAGFAEIFVVYCTFDSKQKHKGLCAVIVEHDRDGIEIGKPEKKMGHRCSDTRAMTFKNVKVPKENLLGKLGDGWKIAMKTLDHSRPLIGSSAVGGAQAALDHSLRYAKERIQFDVPIANHQAIQMIIADMTMKVEASRLLVQKAAWLLDNGQKNTQYASMAKAMASDTCMEVATNAVQIFGGYGYSVEYPVEKIMRDAKLIQIYEGTSQIQRIVIAREGLS